MDVCVIGPMAVTHNGRSLVGTALGGRRSRLLLAALALHDGPLTVHQLADRVWPDGPPRTYKVAIRGLVGGLRSVLGELEHADDPVIATAPGGGYQLGHGVGTDLRHVAEAIRQAEAQLRDSSQTCSPITAAELVAITAGSILADEDGSWLDEHRAALGALHTRALLAQAQAASLAGDHPGAIEVARRAVRAAPGNETTHRLLISVLDAAGDRSGVVEAYTQCRAVLAEGFGIDPSRETIDLYLRALQDEPPSRSARLPVPEGRLIGRDPESELLLAELERSQLVTIVGRGGVGKSRLALHGASVVQGMEGGTFWVRLGEAVDDELVPSAVAFAVRARDAGADPVDSLAQVFAPLGRTVLVLDGCEGVVDGVASLVLALATVAPLVTVLATSRTPLGVPGEAVLDLLPWPVPAGDDAASLVGDPQVQLLLDRVASSQIGLDVHASAGYLAELCRRCGGLPLALELAAGHLMTMSIADIADELEPAVDVSEPVLNVIRSSVDLLNDDEAAVFRAMSVLAGDVPLPLIRAVVDESAAPAVRLARILSELAARHLISVDRSGPRWRYRQDDDIRHFAQAALPTDDHDLAVARLGAALVAMLPDDPRAAPDGYADQVTSVITCIRAYLGAALQLPDLRSRAVELAFRLHRYWATHNISEGRVWLARLLDADTTTDWNDHAHFALGYLTYWSGSPLESVPHLEHAARALEDRDPVFAATALDLLAGCADDLDRTADSVSYSTRSLAVTRRLGDPVRTAIAMCNAAALMSERGDQTAVALADEAQELLVGAGNDDALGMALPTLAEIYWATGDVVRARAAINRARPLLGDTPRIAHVVLLLVSSGLALSEGQAEQAEHLARQAEDESLALGFPRLLPTIRCLRAHAKVSLGDTRGAAAHVVAAIEATRTTSITHPLALCLETATVVAWSAPDADHGEVARLLRCAEIIRRDGERPIYATLSDSVAVIRARLPVDDAAPVLPTEAAELAIRLLTAS